MQPMHFLTYFEYSPALSQVSRGVLGDWHPPRHIERVTVDLQGGNAKANIALKIEFESILGEKL